MFGRMAVDRELVKGVVVWTVFEETRSTWVETAAIVAAAAATCEPVEIDCCWPIVWVVCCCCCCCESSELLLFIKLIVLAEVDGVCELL